MNVNHFPPVIALVLIPPGLLSSAAREIYCQAPLDEKIVDSDRQRQLHRVRHRPQTGRARYCCPRPHRIRPRVLPGTV